MKAATQELVVSISAQAKLARQAILTMTTISASGHPGGSMSTIDILLSLYHVINHDPTNPQKPDRDRVIVSNGHISPAVYSTLGLMGYFELSKAIAQFRLAGSIFEGHIEREVPGVEWSTGNLGQGLSAATGMALASRLNNIPYNVYVIMGDGEQQKGQLSEARRFAAKYKLNNITAIVDYNQLQISGSIHDVMPQNICKTWEADGWQVIEMNGHDIPHILSSLEDAHSFEQPTMILAHTIMGKGVDFMENQAKYHGSTLDDKQLDEALKQLGGVNELKKYRKLRAEFKPEITHHNFALEPDFTCGKPVLYETENDCRSAWGKAIADLARINGNAKTPLVVVDCDLAASVKTGEFATISPDNFIQVGIMEQHAAVMSGALSTCGIQTFWSDFGVFGIGEVYNAQRLNDINHTHLKTVLTHVGLDVGEDGKTHQCIDYISLARNLFGFRVLSPADANHTDRIIRWLANKPGNYLVTMGRSKLPIIRNVDRTPYYALDFNFQYGNADLLRDGNHGSLWVTGTPAPRALKAVDSLREEGIFIELVYVSAPLEPDMKLLRSAAQKGIIFSLEDHTIYGGLGSSIADSLIGMKLCPKLVKMGVKDYAMSGAVDDVYKWAGLDTASIIKTIKANL
ncbi:MAG: transketolase [Candidatus Cloacimonetes bacterium HGW-Cloacimonetes-3]|jgi:transketolase|nr:MAG: transketolase [Candidatus Cloacimonetes bacterium HGW-Cloacimonetes-3]